MSEKNTQELNGILGSTHIRDFDRYLSENRESLNGADAFPRYIKDLLMEKHLTQQMVFLNADIPERYGYKLLSGEKHTWQRDVILRICYAAKLSLAETQRALKKYGMPELYARNTRDALLMLIFQERPGGIIEVNALLKKKGLEPLRTSGLRE